ncbi:hypothetical protein [Petrachloros mirabilis]
MEKRRKELEAELDREEKKHTTLMEMENLLREITVVRLQNERLVEQLG